MPKKLVKKNIFLEPKKVKAIMAETNSVPSTVYQALSYSTNSAKSIEIRRLAVQYGGVMQLLYERPVTEAEIINQFA